MLESVEVDGIASPNTMRNFGSWTALTEVDFSGNGVSYIDESVVSNTCLKIRKFGIKKDDKCQISTLPPPKKEAGVYLVLQINVSVDLFSVLFLGSKIEWTCSIRYPAFIVVFIIVRFDWLLFGVHCILNLCNTVNFRSCVISVSVKQVLPSVPR